MNRPKAAAANETKTNGKKENRVHFRRDDIVFTSPFDLIQASFMSPTQYGLPLSPNKCKTQMIIAFAVERIFDGTMSKKIFASTIQQILKPAVTIENRKSDK